ncbi:FecR domain-containing protein [Phenylobacterium sp.]|jgi:transmembrane sensor|uniref:FecR family protein n=1 Tax=Phenylobacterium sp. TaxID=1871053 RepID=UPI0035B41E86
MTAAHAPQDQIDQEAADWFARLNRLSISSQALEEFQVWRRDPARDAAYERIEELWASAGRLGDHPDTQRAVAAALARGVRKRKLVGVWFRRAGLGAGLAAVAASAALVIAFTLDRGQPYNTGIGEQRLVSLDDGSRLRMDTDTQVRVRFSDTGRRVELVRGQAFFDVAHDASRPFVVRAGDQSIRALGTRFDVRRQGTDVRVTLVEGSVEVRRTGADQAWTLAPGQGLSAQGELVKPPTPVDVGAATSWTSGRLVFRATPLKDAAAEINRYSTAKVVLESPDLQNVQVSGVFDVGDTRAFVAAVCDLFNLQVEQVGGQYRLKARS